MSEDTMNPEQARDALVNAMQGLREQGMPIPDPENAADLTDWINQTFQSMRAFCEMFVDTIVRPALEAIKSIWGSIQRWYRNVRAQGTHIEKQSAWRIMHVRSVRKSSLKRAAIYQRKMVAMHD